MAKLNAVVDTDTGVLEVTVNGATIANVSNVYIGSYEYDGEPSATFELSICSKTEGVHTVTRIMAADQAEKQSLDFVRSKAIAGYVEVPSKTKAQESIAGLFNRQRGK